VEESHGGKKSKTMGERSENGFDASAARTVHERCVDNSENTRVEKGVAQRAGIRERMLTYFINRGGRNLSASRRRELERAKALLSKRMHGGKNSRRRRRARWVRCRTPAAVEWRQPGPKNAGETPLGCRSGQAGATKTRIEKPRARRHATQSRNRGQDARATKTTRSNNWCDG